MTRKSAREEVWHKIRELSNGHTNFVDTHSSDDQFVELVEYFLPKIDSSTYGQEIAEWVFASRSSSGVADDDILDSIKSYLSTLEVPSDSNYIRETKEAISKEIADYKKRKAQQ
jgi:hypothetical protein